MQASKIELNRGGYALQHPELGLVRFTARKIISVRTNNGVPTSHVYGHIEDLPDVSNEKLHGPFDPDLIKGDYREFTELKARQKAEEEARAADRKKRMAVATSLVARLAKLGIKAKASYHYGIEIDEDGVQPLIDLLDSAVGSRWSPEEIADFTKEKVDG